MTRDPATSSVDMRESAMKNEKKKKTMGGILRRFARDTKGNIAITYALALIPMIGVAGFGVDGSRTLLTKFELQAALDAAALAVGSTRDQSVDLEQRLEDFTRENYNASNTTAPVVVLPPDPTGKFTVTASTKVNTFFMNALGVKTVDVSVNTTINSETNGMMLSMVLDNTGSMSGGGKIASLRSATETMINILYGVPKGTPAASVPDNPLIKVSLVPYVTAVNLGDEVLTFASNGDKKQYNKGKWKGCVMEAANDRIYFPPLTGDPEDASSYNETDDNSLTKIMADKDQTTDQVWDRYKVPNNVNKDDNRGCPTPITPLTSDYKKLIDTTKTNTSTGMKTWSWGTITDIGIAWGLRTLMPTAPFTEANEAKDPNNGMSIWDSPNYQKAILIMTDGQSVYNPWSMWNGYGQYKGPTYNAHFGNSTNSWQVPGKIDDRIGVLCHKAKSAGILVFTVTFGSGASSNYIKNIYRDCATQPTYYFHAPGAGDLETAFSAIGSQLSKLRIDG
jgi:Flp pilus assembly protein TadG